MAAVTEGLEAAASEARDAADSSPRAGTEGPLLSGNRLSLDVYPEGCGHLLLLCARQHPQLPEVEFLQLSGHEDPRLLGATLAQVPQNLPRLRSLVLKGGQRRSAEGACLQGSLATLPASLGGLAHLVHLDLSFNSLEQLPACVPHMGSLRVLLLSHNQLAELPATLGALPTLTFLAATHNRLRTLPPTLVASSSLQCLDLSENLLDTVPPEIGGLSRLTELNLASNRLSHLPASLGEPSRGSASWLPESSSGPCGSGYAQTLPERRLRQLPCDCPRLLRDPGMRGPPTLPCRRHGHPCHHLLPPAAPGAPPRAPGPPRRPAQPSPGAAAPWCHLPAGRVPLAALCAPTGLAVPGGGGQDPERR